MMNQRRSSGRMDEVNKFVTKRVEDDPDFANKVAKTARDHSREATKKKI